VADDKLRRAAIQIRDSLNAAVTDATAFIRVLDEIIEANEVPTVRPPSQTSMEAVKVEVVRIPTPRRPR
jgi:hypothetical protein